MTMYTLETTIADTTVRVDESIVLKINVPLLDIGELKDSFYFVPNDKYFSVGSRYRTTSRIAITEDGYSLLPSVPLYQPKFVNKIESYGGIDREYDDVPKSLLDTKAFDQMIKSWLASIPYDVKTFSVHQIRTTDNGNPTPEGAHRDGTDWTGVYIVNRHNISDSSGATKYWDNEGVELIDHVFAEGTLISHHDRYFTHCATSIVKDKAREPSYRDVFVLTSPEHGLNHEEESSRKASLVATM